jgi:hypothetical protein
MGDSWAYDVLLVDINTVGGNPSVLLRNVVRDCRPGTPARRLRSCRS